MEGGAAAHTSDWPASVGGFANWERIQLASPNSTLHNEALRPHAEVGGLVSFRLGSEVAGRFIAKGHICDETTPADVPQSHRWPLHEQP